MNSSTQTAMEHSFIVEFLSNSPLHSSNPKQLPSDLPPEAKSKLQYGSPFTIAGENSAFWPVFVETNNLDILLELKSRPDVVLHHNPMITSDAPSGITRRERIPVDEMLQILNAKTRPTATTSTHVAIIDSGINLEHLNSKLSEHGLPKAMTSGAQLTFDYLPTSFSARGNSHGTLVAFYVSAVAPNAKIIDLPLNSLNQPGARIAEATMLFADLQKALKTGGILGRLVVCNAWETDNSETCEALSPSDPNHCFNRAVTILEDAGADIVFSAPTNRIPQNGAITGPAGHPGVLTMAVADRSGLRFTPQSKGPPETMKGMKPDLTGLDMIEGYDLYDTKRPDEGTSVAAAQASGILALHRLSGNSLAPAELRKQLHRAATAVGPSEGKGFSHLTGYGRLRFDTNLLLHLISDLIQDSKALDNFFKDPDTVRENYNITERTWHVLLSVEEQLIAQHVYTEVHQAVLKVGTMDYPAPYPHIKEVTPNRIRAEQETPLFLSGECLMQHPTVILTNKDNGTKHDYKGISTGPLTCRKVQVAVTLPAGRYSISIENAPGARLIEAQGELEVR